MSAPTARRRERRSPVVGAVVGVIAIVGGLALVSTLGPTGVEADPARRPVATADTFAAFAGGTYTIDVLANDSTSLLSQGSLSLCGVHIDDQTGRTIFAEIDETNPNLVYLETNRTADGNVTFSYDACQGTQRATSVVTVTISKPEPLSVTKKKATRGKLVVKNPNAGAVRVLWGSNRNATSDGNRNVPGRGSIVMKVDRPRIAWVGYLQDRGATIVVGDGTVSGIKQP